MNVTPVGIDIAKSVFQVHYVDPETGEVVNKAVKRAQLLGHFANRAPCLIGMEACSSAHHWARQLLQMGHQVRLMPAQFVKAFNIRNKSDAADAKAIWLAVQQPCKAVAVKTEMQQAVLMMHRQREQLVKFRTMQINGLRGMLAEFGEAMGKGRLALTKAIADAFIRIEERLPKVLIDSLREQWARIEKLDEEIARIERRLREWKKEDRAVKAISEIPGVGLLTATAAVAMIGDPKAFTSGREFAAWVGLVPKQTGSGGKVNLHGISKRGDAYLRKLLIHGARSVLTHAKEPGPWILQIQARRPSNVVVVALANKMARTIWAMLAHDRPYKKDYVSAKPAQAGYAHSEN
ncbi:MULTISPECIES: IS110 family transposase [Caballeronia]|jgi:transposase|uniref:IS110 family transposase n=1 Tax=Caballeronia TaxID=1827195 RepID=UPI001FD0981B|nr:MULTISPECIES: IS110 family transposase [Caballeronia]MDR5799128.1 IS110 family transposase [Caballeronia sp. LZ001]